MIDFQLESEFEIEINGEGSTETDVDRVSIKNLNKKSAYRGRGDHETYFVRFSITIWKSTQMERGALR